jgi:genome maintenance exonuclease 1
LWSEQLGLAGRVDCIGEFDGILSVIDFKTSKRIKQRDDILDYFWQETAYSLMYEELVGEPIHQLVTIMAIDNEPPGLFIEKTEDHIDGLVKAIQFYKEQK